MSRIKETRDHIIEQVAPIFNMHGYEGTSMSQLCKAINMTKGAIYGNFKNKDEIALAALEYNIANISMKISKVVKAKKNSCDKLIAFANYYPNHFPEISNYGGCPILNAAVDSDHSHKPLKDFVVYAIENWMSNIVNIIYSGIKKEEINPRTKPEQFASIFVSLLEGGFMLSKVTGDTIHLSRNVDHIIYLVNTELRS